MESEEPSVSFFTAARVLSFIMKATFGPVRYAGSTLWTRSRISVAVMAVALAVVFPVGAPPEVARMPVGLLEPSPVVKCALMARPKRVASIVLISEAAFTASSWSHSRDTTILLRYV